MIHHYSTVQSTRERFTKANANPMNRLLRFPFLASYGLAPVSPAEYTSVAWYIATWK